MQAKRSFEIPQSLFVIFWIIAPAVAFLDSGFWPVVTAQLGKYLYGQLIVF